MKDFNNIMARAQKLMLDDNFNRTVENRVKANKGMTNESVDISYLEQQAFGTPYSDNGTNQTIQMIQEQHTQPVQNFDNLPSGLRESFMKQPPIVIDNTDAMNPMSVIEKNLSVKRQNLNEVKQQNIMNNLPTNGSIDYTIIKAIIDESVKRNLSEMGGMLNESNTSTFRGMKFCPGNKVQFVDNKGNLYEAVFTLKKRAKQ